MTFGTDYKMYDNLAVTLEGVESLVSPLDAALEVERILNAIERSYEENGPINLAEQINILDHN